MHQAVYQRLAYSHQPPNAGGFFMPSKGTTMLPLAAELLRRRQSCVECLGQGLCYSCQGDGRMKRRDTPCYVACDACPGDGTCQECLGRGWTLNL
jgi:hypothetical protein